MAKITELKKEAEEQAELHNHELSKWKKNKTGWWAMCSNCGLDVVIKSKPKAGQEQMTGAGVLYKKCPVGE